MHRNEKGQSVAAVVLAVFGAMILIVLIVVAGYQGGWWLQKSNANHGAQIRRASDGAQTAYRAEMVRKIQDVKAIDVQIAESPEATAVLTAQRVAIVNIVCSDNAQIQGGLDSATATFVAKEC